MSIAEAARQLHCSTGVIYSSVSRAGPLDARRGQGNRLCIPWNDRIQAASATASPHPGTSTPQPGAQASPPAELAP